MEISGQIQTVDGSDNVSMSAEKDINELTRRITREQERLMAEVAHEIRNPMNVLQGFAEILARETYGAHSDKRYLEYSKIIHRECGKLMRICERMMIASEDNDAANDHIHQTSVIDAVERSLQMFNHLAENRGVELKTFVDPDFPALNIDSDVLDSVLDNLVSNAIKFTPSGGTVTVKATVDEDGAMILVISDTGVGMSWGGQKIKPRKGQETGPHGDKSFGLGLSIIERELSRYGASLAIESDGDTGTTAKVRFPEHLIVR